MKLTNHTFVILAYQESPYLQECIDSLMNQRLKTNIIMTTSTPCKYITELAKKNKIPLFVNEGEKGITQDWNFAIKMAKTDYVTLAHQDDVYKAEYVQNMFSYMRKANKPLIFFSDYSEIRNGKEVKSNRLLNIKRILLLPLRWRKFWENRVAKWFVLAFGSGICCPSVTYYKPAIPNPLFAHHFRSNEDWEAWARLYDYSGSFVYCAKILMSHRIHKDSETSKIIADKMRSNEDYELFKKFWPKPIASVLTNIYSLAQNSNAL